MAKHLSLLLILACFSTSFSHNRKDLRTKEKEKVLQLGRAPPHKTIDPSRVSQLSWRPRVFLYKGFLSDEECNHLISLGTKNRKKSSGNDSNKAIERTTKLDISIEIEDKTTARIEERISAWTFLPKGNGKPFHVMHVGPEEANKPNHDYFGNTTANLTGETLLATVVLYLSNVTLGGHIVFPEAESGSPQEKNKNWSDCSSPRVRPTKGNAVLFFNLHPNASPDRRSSHARCPLVEGDMWWATKIFVVKSVVTKGTGEDDGCMDEEDNCPRWAASGECERNPIFMVGDADYYGTCRKSCNVC